MSDWPIPELGNLTPLQAAHTPNMDQLVTLGRGGLAWTVPEGLYPGSDVANMGILGYDPREYYTGRGAIEAAAMGIQLNPNEVVFRCNLVTIQSDIMTSFTSGHISTEQGHEVIGYLNQQLNMDGVRFYAGVGYRHLVVVPDTWLVSATTPPHDLTDQSVVGHWPRGGNEAGMHSLIQRCRAVLANCDINRQRELAGELLVTDIWPWSPGRIPELPSFQSLYQLTGGIRTAVDLLMGLAQLSGLAYPFVSGATGFIGTNYKGKVQAAFDLLRDHDFAFIHIEAPDECGHLGDAKLKCQAIEEFDQYVVGPMLNFAQSRGGVGILVLPDHPTPCAIKTHVREAVPVAIMAPWVTPDAVIRYDEESCARGGLYYETPWALMNEFLGGGRS